MTNMIVSSCLDELGGFEEAWKGNVRKHLPGWSEEFGSRDGIGMLFIYVSRVFFLLT